MNNLRYSRQISLDRMGIEGQERLSKARVAIIGCGGLGGIAATYLAGAGVGNLTLVDGDIPDTSNLHRQVMYMPGTEIPKAEALRQYIRKFNPEIMVKAIPEMVEKSNIVDIIIDVDLVLECTDDVYVKYLVNDACNLNHIPMIYGAIHKYDGYVSFFPNKDENTIHLRDIFPVPDTDLPSCEEVGVMNTLAGIIGLMQANEAIKHLSKAGPTLEGQLLIYDNIHNSQVKMKLKKSWKEDIEKVWISNDYSNTVVCDVPEITVESFLDNVDRYTVVSILNNDHHVDITPETLHVPASEFNIYDWDPDEEKSTVIYCRSGKVSLQLALSLKEEYPEFTFLSLKGGIKAYQKYLKQP